MPLPALFRRASLLLAVCPLVPLHAAELLGAELIRNHEFELANTLPAGYASGWFASPSYARVEQLEGSAATRVLRLEAADEAAFVHQELPLPERLDAATLGIRLRVVPRFADLPPLPGEQVTVFFGLMPYLDGDNVDLDNALYGGALFEPVAVATDWVDGEVVLPSAALTALRAARRDRRRVALYFRVIGNGQRFAVQIDRASLRVDGARTATGQAGEIAFVDAGRLQRIAPDGETARTVWSHPGARPELLTPRWRPDGNEIAFISDHELAFSPYLADLYAIGAEGGGLRRLTNSPAQADILAGGRPSGRLRLILRNDYSDPFGDVIGSAFVLPRGAANLVPVTLPGTGNSVTVEIDGVAQLDDTAQPVLIFYSSNRCGLNRREVLGRVRVVPGQTVSATLGFAATACGGFQASVLEASWNRLGSELGYNLSSAAFKVPLAGSLEGGGSWFSSGLINGIAWSPVDDRMLYSVATLGLYLRDLNGTAAPQLLIPDQIAASPDEPAWLPDGSGFLYRSGNEIWQADAHGMQRQRLLVAARDERFVRPSASPDGRWIVFERQIGSDSTLWLMQRDDPTSVRPLVTGRQPDWSRVSPTRPARIWGNGFEASSPVSRGRGQP